MPAVAFVLSAIMEMMMEWGRALRAALAVGTVASVTSTVALGVLARLESKAALQPVNATSHWLNGDEAGSFIEADIAHTAVGYVTHHAATVFWAAFFIPWIGARGPLAPLPMLRRAVAMSAVAAAVDYGATPKRFTPGWELVLSKWSMAAAYGAMAVGLAAGGLMVQSRKTHVLDQPRAAPRFAVVSQVVV